MQSLRRLVRPMLFAVLGGLGLVTLSGCLGDAPATPTLAAQTPTPGVSLSAVPTVLPSPADAATLVPPSATPAPAPAAPTVAPDRAATPRPVGPTVTLSPALTATRTPTATVRPARPSGTATITPTAIPTTVPLARLKVPGGLIAFERDNQVWTATTDGKTVRQVTQGGRSYRPVWSPDGMTLAVLSNQDDPRYRLYLMDAAGGNVRAVSGAILAAPAGATDQPDLFGLTYAFSPDGKRLAYIVQLEPYVSTQLMLLDVAGGTSRALTDPNGTPAPTRPVPSPTPTRSLAASLTASLAVSSTATLAPTATMTPPPLIITTNVSQIAWAPDNRTLAYVDMSDLDQDVLYSLDVDTGQRTQLTHENAVNRSPVFSKDGKTIYYTSSADASMAGLKSELYSVRRDGKGRQKLTPGFAAQPGWGTLHLAPDNSQLAIDWSERLGGFGDPWSNEVTLVFPTGKNPVDLSGAYPRPYYGADGPSWSPGSAFLAFHLYYCPNAECKGGTNKIVIADTNAKKVTLAVLTDGWAPSWQP